MTSKRIGLALVALGVFLGGCAKNDAEVGHDDSLPPPKEATAWWTTDAVGAGATSGPPKPGWAKLAAIDSALAAQGKVTFDKKGCASCHAAGKATDAGPELLGVTTRVEPDWLERWLRDPGPMLESDAYAKELQAKFMVKMPNLNLTAGEIKALVEMLRQADDEALKSQ